MHCDARTVKHSRAIMLETLVIPFALVLVSASLAAWVLRRPRHLKLPPGPKGWPLIGVLPAFYSAGDPLQLMTEWTRQYGDVVSFSVGSQVVVLISDQDLIREAFQLTTLNGRPRSLIVEETMGIRNRGILLSSGQTWKEHRNLVHGVFRQLGVGRQIYKDTIAGEVQKLVDSLDDQGSTKPFDPHHFVGNAVFNVICSLLFGTQYCYNDPEFKQILNIIDTNFRLSSAGGTFFFLPIPHLSKVPFGMFKEMADNMKDMTTVISEKIHEHQKELDPTEPKDFIDIYLCRLSQNKGEETTMDEKNLFACIVDLISAGTETTTSTLTWALVYMATWPDVQSRVQAELDRVVGRHRMPELHDRQSLPYTDATILEVLRMSAVVPLGVPHVAEEDTHFHGYDIPKGAVVISALYDVLMRNETWYEPLQFDPQRFMQEGGDRLKELIPFAAGRRSCLGEQLARMEVFLFLTGLLHRFTFSLPPDAAPISHLGVLGATRGPGPFTIHAVRRD